MRLLSTPTLFLRRQVPKEHPEIVRLAEEYAATGGIQEGTAVKLMNDATALVVKVTHNPFGRRCGAFPVLFPASAGTRRVSR
jgi:hypothetical protein